MQEAVGAVAQHQPGMQLGIRPFLRYKEMLTWFPNYVDETASPAWLLIKEGKIQKDHFGFMKKQDIEKFLEN